MREIRTISPVGSTAEEASARRAGRSARYREEQQRLADYEKIARLVIKYRNANKLSQIELAARVGTSYSAISRIERGQHATTVETLRRIASALGLALDIDFVPLRRSGAARGANGAYPAPMAAARR